MDRRDVLTTMGALAVSGLATDGLAADTTAKQSSAKKLAGSVTMAAASPVLSKAWDGYYAALGEMRTAIEATPIFQQYPRDRAKAYHTLMEMQAMAYNFIIAPRMTHPRIFFNCGWQTDQFTLGQNGPDFRYGVLFVDGRQSYRLSGRMGDISLFLLQTLNGVLGEKGVKTTGNYDWNDFNVAADGRFEVILSAEKHPGNWIPIDPDSGYQFMFMRRALPNWHGDPGELRIDPINEIAETHYDADEFDEAAMAARIHRAESFVRYLMKDFTIGLYELYFSKAGRQKNVLALIPGTNAGQLGSPSSNYALGVFELNDDEALVIEMDKAPDGVYWSFQLGDVWSRALPFATRHSSINNLQSVAEAGGGLRAVISHRDPGITNWLDTCGHNAGTIVFRNYRAKTAPVPKVSRVKFVELDGLLPKDVARVTLQQRKEIVEDRRLAQLKWYGE